MGDNMHINIVNYASGLGLSGIMPPKLRNTIEIVGSQDGATVEKREFDNGMHESSVHKGSLDSDALRVVFALVEELQELPKQAHPGGPDVFGENTTVLVRKGKNILWGYNPGGGCDVPDETSFSVNSEHKSKFSSIVRRITEEASTSVSNN